MLRIVLDPVGPGRQPRPVRLRGGEALADETAIPFFVRLDLMGGAPGSLRRVPGDLAVRGEAANEGGRLGDRLGGRLHRRSGRTSPFVPRATVPSTGIATCTCCRSSNPGTEIGAQTCPENLIASGEPAGSGSARQCLATPDTP